MNIVILGGAGLMGSGTVRDLVSELSSGVESLVVADVSPQRMDELLTELNDDRISSVILDVTNKEATMELLRNADICINAVPTFAGYQMDIFHYCLEAKTPYVDYGGMGVYTVKQKKEHAEWEKAGVTAVLGLGADPGMSNMTCKAVAERLDTIDKINLYWAAEIEGPENPVLVPPYSESTVLGEYANNSQQFLDGALREVGPQTGNEIIDLPEPWGRTEFIYSQHSEPLTVPFAHGFADKGIKEFTWKLSLPAREHEAWVGIVKAGFGDFDDPINIKGVDIKPVEYLQAVIRRNIERNKDKIPEQEGYEIHFAIGEGIKDGKKTRVKCVVSSKPDPLYDAYNDAATSMNVSIGAQLLLRNALKPGVWGPEEYYDVEEYFKEVKRRRFHVEIETNIIEEL
ncbi:saccharopine dehydrogenase NADP-binding domain-containing protein [Dasania sp. GY-MA-18]|uniref:Saccharopine dehydrogenase NADP-binding domain-containing protein n=1 Tax=Dasania phycosphaerae TaxID=2950436 RepID=A0A9J6RLS6_9GAMM|nr:MULTISPECIES: saccharopine dehydrogenase NADP-binding domain-containing protein [Dasania]MCR8922834.1 saccharopine dehydrogenase NADP-binding domain-containing protein [Dasania sp. GY-MA-18]MCZ0865265.1 saccharopine dehydrogenase NADP-binding domain-containing protein [Dasania phycosphaerae]MCZ0868990.1 saccharopine dehydrogenase NADP-binding domain-containing protein [Dasania phycosphaerae]